VRLGFQKTPLSVCTARLEVTASLRPAETGPELLPVALRLEACDDRSCLRPEDLLLRVAVAPAVRSPNAPF
jgi:hypothetical protein